MTSPHLQQLLANSPSSPPAATLLIPLGSTEQHGPHLPLETDSIIAHEWALAVATTTTDVVVAPVLPFGSSGEHQAFSGTISIGREALASVLIEMVRSAAHDFNRFIFVSGHAGNAPVLDDVVTQLRYENHDVDVVVPSWPKRFDPVDAHAGRIETGLMLHLRPSLVGPFDQVGGNVTPLAQLLPDLIRDGLGSVTETGVLGDPSSATKEEGRELFTALVATLRATLER